MPSLRAPRLLDRWLGTPVRRILCAPVEKPVYLTFDDGPDLAATPSVLKLLESKQVEATFFVVAEKARKAPSLIEEIRARGHAFGNHSLDHRYGPFFRGKRAITEWVRRAESELSGITGAPTVGFRPPAGVRTPELAHALARLELPLVMWDVRFYDAVRPWTLRAAQGSARRIAPGSIILLHDRQRPANLPSFLRTLEAYIDLLRKNGFVFRRLTRDLCDRVAGYPAKSLSSARANSSPSQSSTVPCTSATGPI